MGRIKDVTGQKFYKLTAIKVMFTRNKMAHWLFRCDCGNEKVIRLNAITHGTTRSCGCLATKDARAKKSTKHGMHKSRLYRIRQFMIQRCINPKHDSYYLYGGKGINVCDEWMNSFESFHAWAMSNGYKDSLSIDRIDSNHDYEPSNCRWATQREQATNRRTSIIIGWEGKSGTIQWWSEQVGIHHATLWYRYKKKGMRPPELFVKRAKS
jgi:hypothetical protein